MTIPDLYYIAATLTGLGTVLLFAGIIGIAHELRRRP